MTKFKKGDFVILIDDESPEQNRKRLGKKEKRKKDNISRKMSYLDTIDSVKNKVATTKSKKFKAKLNGNAEAQEMGMPKRKMYKAKKEWFQLPKGLNCDIESVELDERFVENVVIPYNNQGD